MVKNPEMIQVLLTKGADPNARSKVLPEDQIFGRMLFGEEKGENILPLHGLLKRFRYSTLDIKDVAQECCKILIDAGGDVNAVDDDGRCPKHYSTSPAFTSLLLQHGAKNIRVKEWIHTAAIRLQKLGRWKTYRVMRHAADINAKRHVDGKTPLYCLLEDTDSYNTSLKEFLAFKSDVNAEDDVGNTPLHLILQESPDQDVVQALLDAGADPNHTNINMETPIHTMTYSSSDVKVVRVLVSAGASLEARDNLGRTPLLRAVGNVMSHYNLDGAKIVELVELGDKVEARDIHGNSALHLICQKLPVRSLVKHSDQAITVLLQFLIDAGVDPKWINHEGNTLFHEVLRVMEARGDQDRSARVQFLETLLELGVPLKRKNYFGATALHIACSTTREFSYAHVGNGIIDLLVGLN